MFRSSLIILAVGASLLVSGPARAAGKPHPHIHRALYELRQARAELKAAAHDFGGHRKQALAAVNAAIDQLGKALKYSGDNRPFKGDPKAEHSRKYASFPHIHHAVVELKGTVAELRAASHDYGGHRKAALADTQAAIKQLELCLPYARRRS
jgi:hypothetical protein